LQLALEFFLRVLSKFKHESSCVNLCCGTVALECHDQIAAIVWGIRHIATGLSLHNLLIFQEPNRSKEISPETIIIYIYIYIYAIRTDVIG
jgi:hypothetical protein